MSVVTKRSSNPVATLAITLLTATLPAQCEKLSTLKPDSVHGRQTVLHTRSGSIRCYQSDEMWSYQLWVSVQYCMRTQKTERVCASVCEHDALHFFWGTPDDSAPWKRAYPKLLNLNAALLGHRLQSGDRGRHRCDNRGNFSDFMMSFLLPMKCAAWAASTCVYVCIHLLIDEQDVMASCNRKTTSSRIIKGQILQTFWSNGFEFT